MATRWGSAPDRPERPRVRRTSLGRDDPFGLAERREKRRERVARREIGLGSKELQLAGVEGGQEFFEKETTEQPRENAHVQKEAGPAGTQR